MIGLHTLDGEGHGLDTGIVAQTVEELAAFLHRCGLLGTFGELAGAVE